MKQNFVTQSPAAVGCSSRSDTHDDDDVATCTINESYSHDELQDLPRSSIKQSDIPKNNDNITSSEYTNHTDNHAQLIPQPDAAHLRFRPAVSLSESGLAPTLTPSRTSKSSFSSNTERSHDFAPSEIIELQEISGDGRCKRSSTQGGDGNSVRTSIRGRRQSGDGDDGRSIDDESDSSLGRRDGRGDEDEEESATAIPSPNSTLTLENSVQGGSADRQTNLGVWGRLEEFWGTHIRVTVPWKYARDHLALERTFLSYHRTSLALGIASTVVIQLHTLNVHDYPADPEDRYYYDVAAIGKPLAVILAALALVFTLLGWIRWLRFQGSMLKGKCLAGGWELGLAGTLFFLLLAVSFGMILGLYIEKVVLQPTAA